MKNKFLHLTDLIFLMRPVLLIPVWGFSLFGYYKAKANSISELIDIWHTTSVEVYLLLFIFSLSVGSVYIFNQIADIEVDKKNGGLPLIASGIITLRSAMLFTIIISILSILLPLLLHHKEISILCVFSIITGLLYSFKPFYFSGRPFLDFLSNASGYGIIAFGAGWVCGGKVINMQFLISSLPYFLLMSAGSISSTLPDTNGDAAEGKNTTAVTFGRKNAHLLATMILLSAVITSIIQSDLIAMICSLFPIPIYLGYIIKPNTLYMESTYKIGGAICMFCSGIILPLIIPAAVIVYFLTWLYFRIRHGVTYPSLVSVQNE